MELLTTHTHTRHFLTRIYKRAGRGSAHGVITVDQDSHRGGGGRRGGRGGCAVGEDQYVPEHLP